MELLFYYLIWSNSSPTIIPVSNAVFFFILLLSKWLYWNEKENENFTFKMKFYSLK